MSDVNVIVCIKYLSKISIMEDNDYCNLNVRFKTKKRKDSIIQARSWFIISILRPSSKGDEKRLFRRSIYNLIACQTTLGLTLIFWQRGRVKDAPHQHQRGGHHQHQLWRNTPKTCFCSIAICSSSSISQHVYLETRRTFLFAKLSNNGIYCGETETGSCQAIGLSRRTCSS